jgi:hypothetical protein
VKLIFTPSGHQINLPDEVQRLAESCSSIMMDSAELLALAATLFAYPWVKGAIVVEIGAYLGQTTIFMAKVFDLLGIRIPIVSIDPFERAQPDSLNPQGVYSAYMENIRSNKLEGICIPLVAFSADAAPVVPEKIGVLVVDGCHYYSGVKKDLELYTLKVMPNGFIFIDDYGSAYPDVIRAVDEFFKSNCSFSILHMTYFVVAQKRDW